MSISKIRSRNPGSRYHSS